MTTASASFRDVILSLLAIIANLIFLPVAFFNCTKALFSEKKRIVPKVVAITGANSGIGEGIAYAYAKDNVSLVLLARNMERLEKVADACKEFGSPNVHICRMDVSDTQSVKEFFDEKTIEYDIDLFIANAGIAGVPNTSILDEAEAILQTNVMGTIAGINAVYKAMKKRGRGGQIAVMSSVTGFFSPPILLSYATSKAAVLSYCRDLRSLGKDDQITINTIAPGYIATEMTKTWTKKNKSIYLTPEYFGQQVKVALEYDVPLISLPLHQFFTFATANSLTPVAKQFLSDLVHKWVMKKLIKKKK